MQTQTQPLLHSMVFCMSTNSSIVFKDSARGSQTSFFPFYQSRGGSDERGGLFPTLSSRSTYKNLSFVSVEQCVKDFSTWKNDSLLLTLKQTNVFTQKTSYYGYWTRKRGNAKYRRWVNGRFNDFVGQFPDYQFFEWTDKNTVKKTPMLFITLTYNPSIISIEDAWNNYSKDLNKYMSHLRYLYGKCATLKAVQSHRNGYPHLHIIVYFREHDFAVSFRRRHKIKKSSWVYRINGFDRSLIKSKWVHGFIDVCACYSLAGALDYIGRDVLDDLLAGSRDKCKITLAMTWFFKKRLFSLSGEFRRLDKQLYTNSKKIRQLTLNNTVIDVYEYRLVCLVKKSTLLDNIPSIKESRFRVNFGSCLPDFITERVSEIKADRKVFHEDLGKVIVI